MQNLTGNKRLLTAFFACSAFFCMTSCVEEAYDLDNINLEVTLGQSGLALPIGNTKQLKVNDLVEELDQDILTQINGTYALKVADTLDLSNNLPDINEMLHINDISVRERFQYALDDLSADGMSIDPTNFNTKLDLSKELAINMDVPRTKANEKIKLGLYDYAAKIKDIDLNSSLDKKAFASKAKFTLPSINPGIAGEIQIPEATKNIETQKAEIEINFKSPDAQITNIRDVRLSSSSKMTVRIEVSGHEFIKKGDLIPNITLDCGNLFGITTTTGAPVGHTITFNKTLNKGNNFSTEQVYNITSLNIKSSDWNNGTLQLINPISVAGTMSMKNASTDKTTLNNYSGNGEMKVNITLTFAGFSVKSAVFDLKDTHISQQKQIKISLGEGIDVPENVKSIDNVIFTESSEIKLGLVPENLSITNLNATVESLSVKFPSAMSMKGASGGILNFGPFDIKNGFNKSAGIERIDFPATATTDKLRWEDFIEINADMTVSGTGINSADFPADAENDSAVTAKAETNLEIKNWYATINEFQNTITPITEVFTQDLDGRISDFGTFKVTPAGNPLIDISVEMPAGLRPEAGNEGLTVTFPDFIKFRNVNPSYEFDETANSITFRKDIPQRITMPVSHLVVTPELKPDGNGHQITGEFNLKGNVKLAGGQIAGNDIEELGKKGVRFNIAVPKITPAKVSLEDFKIDINEEFATTLIKGADVPAEILSITEAKLHNVYAGLGLTLSGMPEIGSNTELLAELEITLPEEIVLDQNDSRVQANILTINTPVINNRLNIEPVQVCELDLSGYDFSKKEDLNSKVKVNGRLRAIRPDIDINQSMTPVKAELSTSIENIRFSKISGRVDYAIDKIDENFALTDIPDFIKDENTCLDIENPYLFLKAKTNMGVPMQGTINIIPVRNGIEDKDEMVSLDVTVKGSPEAAKKDSTMYFIAATEKGCPQGCEFIKNDVVKSLIRKIPDEIKLSFEAKTSESEDCIIEPQESYMLDVEYALVAPMEFGKDLNLELKDTLTGIDETFRKIIKDNKIQLGGEVTNKLPLQLDLEINMLDNNDKIIQLAKPAVQTLAACAPDGSANVIPLDLMLEVSKETDLSDLKGLMFTFKVTSGNVAGIPVTDECFVQAKVSAKLPEGISLDLNDFNKESDGENYEEN